MHIGLSVMLRSRRLVTVRCRLSMLFSKLLSDSVSARHQSNCQLRLTLAVCGSTLR